MGVFCVNVRGAGLYCLVLSALLLMPLDIFLGGIVVTSFCTLFFKITKVLYLASCVLFPFPYVRFKD